MNLKKMFLGLVLLFVVVSGLFVTLNVTAQKVEACDTTIRQWYLACLRAAGPGSNFRHEQCLQTFMDYCGY